MMNASVKDFTPNFSKSTGTVFVPKANPTGMMNFAGQMPPMASSFTPNQQQMPTQPW
jgi:hypothetical protein